MTIELRHRKNAPHADEMQAIVMCCPHSLERTPVPSLELDWRQHWQPQRTPRHFSNVTIERINVAPRWANVVKDMPLEQMVHTSGFQTSWIVDASGVSIRRVVFDEVQFGRAGFGHRQVKTVTDRRANVKHDVELTRQEHDASCDRAKSTSTYIVPRWKRWMLNHIERQDHHRG